MSKAVSKLPYRISEYIQERFNENFLFHIKESKDQESKPVYSVRVDHDNLIYHLKFNAEGMLLQEEADPAFPSDNHEDTPEEEGFHPDDY